MKWYNYLIDKIFTMHLIFIKSRNGGNMFKRKDDVSKIKDETIINRLRSNEDRLAKSSKKTMELTSSLSTFDVDMKYISNNSMEAVKEMESLSSSNLAIIEETTATMNQVTETIDNTVDTF